MKAPEVGTNYLIQLEKRGSLDRLVVKTEIRRHAVHRRSANALDDLRERIGECCVPPFWSSPRRTARTRQSAGVRGQGPTGGGFAARVLNGRRYDGASQRFHRQQAGAAERRDRDFAGLPNRHSGDDHRQPSGLRRRSCWSAIPALAHQALTGQGFAAALQPVLAVVIADRPGGLHDLLEGLAERQINVLNAYGFVTAPGQSAVWCLEVADLAETAHLVEARGWRVLKESELYRPSSPLAP